MERPTPPPYVAPLGVAAQDPGAVLLAESSTAPAARPPRWSGRKTAVAAALALGVATAGTAAAAAAFPAGSGADANDPGAGRGGQSRQLPAQQGQLPQGPQQAPVPRQGQAPARHAPGA